MNSLILLFVDIFVFMPRIESIDEPLPLCDNPVIHSADRMVNGTIRLYRDYHYWELKGIPAKEGFLLGPYRVWYSNFAPIHKNTSILSCIECNRKGFIYKFEGLKYWSYEPSGRQWKGGQNGEDFKYLSIPTGFNAVFHNGMANNSMMIGVSGHRVFYYSTKGYYIEPAIGYDTKGYEGGRDDENFPTDITAAFSWFASNSQDGYEVYIFREDKYCFRSQKLKSGQQCDEWRDNKELFGCNRNARQSADSNNQDPNASAEQRNPPKPEENSKQSSEPQSATTTTTALAPNSSADHLLIPSKIAISCALFLFAFYLA